MKNIIYIVLLLSFLPAWSFAWDSQKTHGDLTEAAADKTSQPTKKFLEDQLGFSNNFSEEISYQGVSTPIIKLLQDGSQEEDEPMCRASNHFHNPLKSWDESELTDISFIADLFCGVTKEKYSNISWATGVENGGGTLLPAEINGLESDDNGRNWLVAKDYYYKALTETDHEKREQAFAETFRTLGYVLHLLEDMAVPAHTRNDLTFGHVQYIGCPPGLIFCKHHFIGNRLEGYVRDHWDDIPISSSSYEGEKFLTNFWDTDTVNYPETGKNIGLAEYSNANFVSQNTIFKPVTSTLHYFQYPSKSSIADQDFPEQVDVDLYDVMKDGILDKVPYVVKNKNGLVNDGETIEKFLRVRYVFLGSNGDNDYAQDDYHRIFSLDHEVLKEYATHLVPRAIGYSASLLDYFFRGSLEISPPDQYVYAVVDGSEINTNRTPHAQEIKQIKAKVTNTTPNEAILEGSLVAVASYRKINGYQPDLSNLVEGEYLPFEMRGSEVSYSISDPITIDFNNPLNSDTATEFTFDFTDMPVSADAPDDSVTEYRPENPIPAGITDLRLHLVFKGTMGDESNQAIAVGLKDLSEPQHITFWNFTDYFQLDGSYLTAEEVRQADPLVETYSYIDPHPVTEEIGFSRLYPDHNGEPVPIVNIVDLPPARYSRIIVVTDADAAEYLVTDRTIVSDLPPNEYGVNPNLVEIYKYDHPSLKYQLEVDESGTALWFDNSLVSLIRGIKQHRITYFVRSDSNFQYDVNLPAPEENVEGPHPVILE